MTSGGAQQAWSIVGRRLALVGCAIAGAGALTAPAQASVTIEFRNSRGYWFNADAVGPGVTAPTGLDYDNNLFGGDADVFWGNSTGYGKSGYKFDVITPDLPVGGPTGVVLGPPDDAGPFALGRFKHVNQPITGTFLDTVDFRYRTEVWVDGVFNNTYDFEWRFDHHETTNSQNPCPYGGPPPGQSGINRYGCADRIEVNFLSENNSFVVDDHVYTFNLAGFLVLDGADWVQREVFVTKEKNINTAYVLGTLSRAALPVVPEPGAWALMIMGFGAVGASLRRRRRPRLSGAEIRLPGESAGPPSGFLVTTV